MRVLGIDPGFDRCGAAIIERIDGREVVLFSTCILTDKKAPQSHRLKTVGDALRDIIRTHNPTAVALETLFFNKNITTAIGVAEARGVIQLVALEAGCSLSEYGPQAIKVAVTGYGASDKKSVYSMIDRLVAGVPPKALDDEYDAIAVGLTHLAHHRSFPHTHLQK